jgi:nucleotide-binding universal stress UspA family protein
MHEASRAVTVGVSRSIRGWDALEWAAAEAWARQCPLRIVHVVSWRPLSLYSCGALATDAAAHGLAAGAALLEEAQCRAARVAPGLSIATVLEIGDPASAIRCIGAADALIVLGREHRRHRRLPWIRSTAARVARRAPGPVAIIDLHAEMDEPPAARVVALVDGGAADSPVLDLAFRAARRRGLGVTVARASDAAAAGHPSRRKSVEPALAECRARFRGVHVTEEVLPHPLAPALLNQARGAALVAVGYTLGRSDLAALLTPPSGTHLGPVVVVGTAPVASPARLSVRVDRARPE